MEFPNKNQLHKKKLKQKFEFENMQKHPMVINPNIMFSYKILL